MSDDKKKVDLQKSSEMVGQLYPVIIAADGDIVDGVHRKTVDLDWKEIIIEEIDTEEKKLVARAHANFGRRSIKTAEIRRTINDLAKLYEEQGLQIRYEYKPNYFSNQILSRLTEVLKGCVSVTTIEKHLDDKYKQYERIQRIREVTVKKYEKYDKISAWTLLIKHYRKVLESRFGVGFLERLWREIKTDKNEDPRGLQQRSRGRPRKSMSPHVWGCCVTEGCDNYGIETYYPEGWCEICASSIDVRQKSLERGRPVEHDDSLHQSWREASKKYRGKKKDQRYITPYDEETLDWLEKQSLENTVNIYREQLMELHNDRTYSMTLREKKRLHKLGVIQYNENNYCLVLSPVTKNILGIQEKETEEEIEGEQWPPPDIKPALDVLETISSDDPSPDT